MTLLIETKKRRDPRVGLAARQKMDLISDTGCLGAMLLLSTNYQIYLPFLLPENKLGLLRFVPPAPVGFHQALACPLSSHGNLCGCQQATSLPAQAPAFKAVQLAPQTPAGCAQVAVRKISFDLICKLSRVIETK